MERLNKSGQTLMEYRIGFCKHYSDSVDESLKEAINIMFNEKKIDEKIFRSIFDEKISTEDFELLLFKRKEFTKNNNELTYEFDQVRKNINEYMIEIGFVNSMNTKNSLDMNKIIIIHQFNLNKPYLMSSFGVNNSEIIPLMKRKGFIEKFAVLRLNQVLKEIYSEMRMPEDVDHGYSLVYYNKKTQGFAIDYKFYINVDVASNEDKMKSLVSKIKELDKIIDRKFHNKLGNNYFVEPKNNSNSLKMETITKPIQKQSNIQSPKDIINKKTNELFEKIEPIEKPEALTSTLTSSPTAATGHPCNASLPIDDTNPIPIKKDSTSPVKEPSDDIQNQTKKDETIPKIESIVEEFDIDFDISDKDLL